MVRTALNEFIEDWLTFVQSNLGRATLPSWEEMWEALRQEELSRLTKTGSRGKGSQVKKEEEEDATLASSGQQGQQKRKDITKVRYFNCGELGHYATQCPRRRARGRVPNQRLL